MVLQDNAGASIHAELRASETAPTQARRALAALDDTLPPDLARSVALVASELVTNSVRHCPAGAGSRIEVDATVDGRRVRLSVRDSGGGMFESGPEPAKDALSGWGLHVVDQLVDRWWIDADAGTRVVCELSA